MSLKQFSLLIAWAVAVCVFARTSLAAPLNPDEIALVVNKHVPQGIELARFYAQSRNIPDGRIIELDLPSVEDITFDRYERSVTPAVRQFLRDNKLEDKVRCLVTFYGVPLRIMNRENSPMDNIELSRLRDLQPRVTARLVAQVGEIERYAAAFDNAFKPLSAEQTLQGLSQRADHAGRSMMGTLEETADQAVRNRILAAANDARARLTGLVDISEPFPATAPSTAPTAAGVTDLLERAYDPAARREVRETARRYMGIFAYARILQNHLDYLGMTEETGASFDSELSMLWAPPYARGRWQINMMNLHVRQPNAPRIMMTTRLDAATPQLVRDIVANSILTERDGLKGQLVVDATGLQPRNPQGRDDPKGMFDERLRRLVTFTRTRTDLPITFDDIAPVLPPNSVEDVAPYSGWYSVRRFVPSMKFNRGAVGYHIASFELMTIHNPAETGWVHGLLSSGVVATVGSVAEPYLHSFPPPEEFFPLLLTGKMTLAEVYWSTTTLTSWMQACIGDPLYRPYSSNPKVNPEHLPPALRAALP